MLPLSENKVDLGNRQREIISAQTIFKGNFGHCVQVKLTDEKGRVPMIKRNDTKYAVNMANNINDEKQKNY